MSTRDQVRTKDQLEADGVQSDTLAASLILLLVVTVGQRCIGLGRNILFCGLLEADQLGRWSLSYNFLMLAAPLVVLGLPGSFGRYVEYYRQRIQLRSFLTRTTFVTLAASGIALLVMCCWPAPLAYVIYGDSQLVGLVRLLALTLVVVILFNYLVELFTALRLVRYSSLLQFVFSVTFAGVGAALLFGTSARETAVMMAYGLAALVVVGLGCWLIPGVWQELPTSSERLSHGALWQRLLPFAGWIWLSNLIGNSFEVADQFMLKHFSGLDAHTADSLVGQYYSSRILPLLLLSLATMVASSLLPHLSRDWEAGRRREMRRRMRLIVKLGLLFFTMASSMILLLAPTLFGWALQGRYQMGQTVLPGTLLYCVWFAVANLGLCYLLCADSARLGSLALLFGLLANLALNALLAPRFALYGVVTATCLANAVVLMLVLWMSTWHGMQWDRGVWVASLLPTSLLLGGPGSAAVLAVVVCFAPVWLLRPAERNQFKNILMQLLAQGRARFPSLAAGKGLT